MKRKKCSKCGKKRVLEKSFYKNKHSKDGYQNNCKDCQKGYVYAYYENNKEEIIKKVIERKKKI